MSSLLAVKQRLAPWGRRLALYSGAEALARGGGRTRILMFHGVGVPGMSTAQFRSLLQALSRSYRTLPLEELIRRLEQRGGSPEDGIVLTFDDGLRNNFSEAYPVLRELALPAIFYICPGLIEEGAWLWNHEARARLESMAPEERGPLAASWGVRAGTTELMVEWMKGLEQKRKESVLAELRAATPRFQASEQQRRQYDLMSWEDVRALDPGLITIGAHTVGHTILTGLTSDEALYQLREGRDWCERALGREIRHFCYPNGLYDPSVRAMVEAHYASAVGVEPGHVPAGADRYALRRIPAASDIPAMAWALASWSARG